MLLMEHINFWVRINRLRYIFYIFFVLAASNKPFTETQSAQTFIKDCLLQGDDPRLKEFCECCFIEAQKYKSKNLITTHLEMLENQSINYKEIVEENCMNILF